LPGQLQLVDVVDNKAGRENDLHHLIADLRLWRRFSVGCSGGRLLSL
jgi:hypothetical protein